MDILPPQMRDSAMGWYGRRDEVSAKTQQPEGRPRGRSSSVMSVGEIGPARKSREKELLRDPGTSGEGVPLRCMVISIYIYQHAEYTTG